MSGDKKSINEKKKKRNSRANLSDAGALAFRATSPTL